MEIYYIINLSICGLAVPFSFLTQIERGRTNALYRLWHKTGPILAFLWYIIAFSLFTAGYEQLWMIIVGPFVYCIPLGGLSTTATRASSSEDNNDTKNRHVKEEDKEDSDEYEENVLTVKAINDHDIFHDCDSD